MRKISATRNFKAAFLFLSFFFYAAGFSHLSLERTSSGQFERSLKQASAAMGDMDERKVRIALLKALEQRARRLEPIQKVKLAKAVIRYSKEHTLDPFLLLAVIETESSYRFNAVSNKGAVGFMQVRPFVAVSIASEVDIAPSEAARNLTDMETNLKLGSYYLSKMKKKFGKLDLALEAYNQGPTWLTRILRQGIKPPMKYTRKVLFCRDTIISIGAWAPKGGEAA